MSRPGAEESPYKEQWVSDVIKGETWWAIKDIIDERVVDGKREYLVDWYDDPDTGEAWDKTWSMRQGVTPEALVDWKIIKTERRARARRERGKAGCKDVEVVSDDESSESSDSDSGTSTSSYAPPAAKKKKNTAAPANGRGGSETVAIKDDRSSVGLGEIPDTPCPRRPAAGNKKKKGKRPAQSAAAGQPAKRPATKKKAQRPSGAQQPATAATAAAGASASASAAAQQDQRPAAPKQVQPPAQHAIKEVHFYSVTKRIAPPPQQPSQHGQNTQDTKRGQDGQRVHRDQAVRDRGQAAQNTTEPGKRDKQAQQSATAPKAAPQAAVQPPATARPSGSGQNASAANPGQRQAQSAAPHQSQPAPVQPAPVHQAQPAQQPPAVPVQQDQARPAQFPLAHRAAPAAQQAQQAQRARAQAQRPAPRPAPTFHYHQGQAPLPDPNLSPAQQVAQQVATHGPIQRNVNAPHDPDSASAPWFGYPVRVSLSQAVEPQSLRPLAVQQPQPQPPLQPQLQPQPTFVEEPKVVNWLKGVVHSGKVPQL